MTTRSTGPAGGGARAGGRKGTGPDRTNDSTGDSVGASASVSATESVTVAAPTFEDVRRAARVVKGAVVETDFDASRTLSKLLDADVWLKFENLQFTGAFKERGALNRLAALSKAERARGVIAMSAGNHAQGVAYHAGRLGIPAAIVMPEGTPTVKVENTRALGAEVILHGAVLE
ncbi:MAG: pyridoxal-phosphate dependent enzyme, partial [Hyphomicrobium sp.]